MNASFDDLLGRMAETQQTNPDLHPEMELLQVFAEGRCSPRERELVLRHLEACKSCGDVILSLKEEPDQNLSPEGSPSPGVDAAWDRLVAYAASERGAEVLKAEREKTTGATEPTKRSLFFNHPAVAYGWAAVLLVALSWVAWQWFDSSGNSPELPTRPSGDPQILTLLPPVRTSPSSNPIPSGNPEHYLILEIILDQEVPFDRFRALIKPSHREETMTIDPVRFTTMTGIVILPSMSLDKGVYTLELQGTNETNDYQTITNYTFEIIKSH
ncbi:Zf-HC2 domain-containing protein [Sulfidibacter corallicola]|uniref:Zf-HC2 domain-containing protein n=1 Tax=Sulfidibacter corallicola TaxID=2818388 RepID=A0A8A4TMP9_SULCO|nr:zf-HC2 domain-containing protein [Sulfidibacter corallicola]QTD50484.1 zf-HC2 domain-containing protein [Sulfidibacter corallicola]